MGRSSFWRRWRVLRWRTSRTSGNVRAIVAMVAATFVFNCGDAAMKLAAASLPASQTVALRGLISVAILMAACAWTGALRSLRAALKPAMAARCLGDIGGAVFFQSALARMKFADIMGIIQLTPLSLTAASALFLGERVGWRRWTAVGIGFLGALLVIKPGTSAFDWVALLVVLSVLCGTLRDVSTRRLDRSLSPLLILLVSQTAVTVAGLALALFQTWQAVTAAALAQVGVGSLCSMIGHLCVIASVRAGELSAVAPFRYASIVWAILIGFALWRELPDAWSFAGIAVLIGAGLYTLHRERVVRRGRM